MKALPLPKAAVPAPYRSCPPARLRALAASAPMKWAASKAPTARLLTRFRESAMLTRIVPWRQDSVALKIQRNASRASRAELVLFAFDDRAIPLQRGVELHLKGHRAECGRTRIVPPPGDTIEDGNSPAESGYNQLVTSRRWRPDRHHRRLRLRIDFMGLRPEEARLYAIYLERETWGESMKLFNYPDLLENWEQTINRYAWQKVEFGAEGVAEKLNEIEALLKQKVAELDALPNDPELEKAEPDDLPSILALRPEGSRRLLSALPDDFRDRLEGAWLGRCAGCTLGSIVEGWTVQRMQDWATYLGDPFPLVDYWSQAEQPHLPRLKASVRHDYHALEDGRRPLRR